MADRFALAIDQPWTNEGFARPTDPLGELTPWEAGIQTFLFEHNHRVLVRAGARNAYVFFTPDIVGMVQELPGNVIDLREGRPTQLQFPESTLILELRPYDNSLVSGKLRKFGSSLWDESFQATTDEVVRAIQSLITTIVDQAVAGGYVTRADADAYLANRNP
jgi:hypothetical protein